MVRKLAIVLLLVLFLVPAALADTEWWNTDAFQMQVKEMFKLNFIPELRLRGGELYYSLIYLGPTISLSKNFDVNIFYAPKFMKNGGGWKTSALGFLDMIFKSGVFSNRVRLENDFAAAALKMRDQLQLKNKGWFVYEEFFYNFTKGYLDENRASVGYSFKLFNNFELTAGYLLRSQKSSANAGWLNTNVLLINTGLKI